MTSGCSATATSVTMTMHMTMTVSTTAMIAAGVTFAVIMMITTNSRIIGELSSQKVIYCCAGITLYASIESDMLLTSFFIRLDDFF